MDGAEDRSGAAASAAHLSWEAFRHHRQAYLDRRQIARMEEQLGLDPGADDLDEDDLDDVGGDDERGGWTLFGY